MEGSLYYQERGAGEPLILLHGNGESGDYFKSQMDAFSPFFRVIAVDTRGHGRSLKGDAPFTLLQFSRDLRSFLLQQKIEKGHLLGFSDGANIALLFALAYPEMVDKLILNSGNLFPRGMTAPVWISVLGAYGLTCLLSPVFKSMLPKKELLGLMATQPHLSPKELEKITADTLVIAGSKDMIRQRHTRLIAASIPNARLVILPGDHFVAAKNSAAFNEAVTNFLLS